MMKKTAVLIIVIGASLMLRGQEQKRPPLVYTSSASLKLIGQAFPLKNSFHRVDTAAYPDLPAAVKRLLIHSTGLAISFKTNSPTIAAQWCVSRPRLNSNNMTGIAVKGLDLYIKRNGKWEYAGVGRPDSSCTEFVLVQNMDKSEKECLLYLPLYEELKSLSVGIESGSQITGSEDPFTKKHVVVYGSSIVHGSSASRPGMAYPARLSRETGIHFLNLGVSGNAKMEKAVADMVADIQADAYVLDCVPNSSPEQITERTAYLVKTIRAKHPDAPIIIIQSIIREGGNFDLTIKKHVQTQNENIQKEYQKLKQEGVTQLYFISADNLLGKDHEGTTDGTHPNDLGFDRMLQVLKPKLVALLR